MDLAKLSPQDLWDTFGMEDDTTNDDGTMKRSYGKDPFSLQELEQGKCPSGMNTAEWLPPRPWNSEEIASMFQRKVEQLKNTDQGASDEETTLVWYEHMTEAKSISKNTENRDSSTSNSS